MSLLKTATNVADFAAAARRRLPRVVWDYLDGGAEDETTLRDNRAGFERLKIMPRVLTGNAKRDQSVELFGTRFASPFMIGPTGLNGLFWPDADLALARAAASADVGFALSTASNNSLEEVAATGSGTRWFQLYPWGDAAFSARLLERAKRSGYSAVIVTIDTLTAGKRERDLRNGFSHELRITPRVVLDGLAHPAWLRSVWLGRGMPRFENLAEFLPPGASASQLADFTRSQRNPSFAWEDIERLKRTWEGPLLVKGILASADAVSALEAGADGVVVSNHGGRQLDGVPATIDALPDVVAAIGGRGRVLVDGGLRRGSDIVKAVALGADAVLLGRSTLYGLAAAGQAGATRVLAILRDEVDRTLALAGARSLVDLQQMQIVSSPPSQLRHGALGRVV